MNECPHPTSAAEEAVRGTFAPDDELDSLTATDAIAFAICRHLGKRFRVSSSDFHARKLKLRRQLGLPVERW